MKNLVVIVLTLLCLGACSPGHNDYSNFTNLSPQGWAYGDDVVFVPDTVDSVASGALSIELRHNNSYPFSNLWLEICYRDNGRLHRDTVNLTLADIYGRWHGQGFGASYQFSRPFNPDVTMARGDSVSVRHIMRVDTVEGIEQIGIKFTKRQ